MSNLKDRDFYILIDKSGPRGAKFDTVDTKSAEQFENMNLVEVLEAALTKF